MADPVVKNITWPGWFKVKLIELKEYFSIEDALVEEKATEWFGCGNAQHDARFDTAMTYLCLKAGADAGMVKGVL